MNSYLLTVLIKNDLEEKDRKELLDSITKKIAKVEKENLWGTRDLSYAIKHADKAFYAHFEFSEEPQNIPSLDKMIKLNEDIIRYLLIKR